MLVKSGFYDPETGEPLYVDYIPRGWVRRFYRRMSLFFRIVWRRWEKGRINISTAWDVASGIWGKDGTP